MNKKFYVIMFAVLAFAMIFSACGPAAAPEAEEAVEEVVEEVEEVEEVEPTEEVENAIKKAIKKGKFEKAQSMINGMGGHKKLQKKLDKASK